MRNKNHVEPGIASVLASSTSGFVELLIFHPLDTLTKRIINNREPLRGRTLSDTVTNLNTTIFRSKAQANALRKYISLFPGLRYAILYKVSQRTYQFGGHPFVSQYLKTNYMDAFESTLGTKKAKLGIHAVGGVIIGVGEVLLLPLDLLKVRGQTAKQKVTFRDFLAYFGRTGSTMAATRALYRGAGWTACRNAVGCFALFGTAAFVKESVFELQDYTRASFFQDFVASSLGAFACVAVADVIKVRIQAAPLGPPVSGFTILSNLLKVEGIGALTKGLIPKLIGAGPKVAFGFTISSQLAQMFSSLIGAK